jgi:hypothetical protein
MVLPDIHEFLGDVYRFRKIANPYDVKNAECLLLEFRVPFVPHTAAGFLSKAILWKQGGNRADPDSVSRSHL